VFLHRLPVFRGTIQHSNGSVTSGVDQGVDSVFLVVHLDAGIDLLIAYKTDIFRLWCSVQRRLDSALVCFGCRRMTVLGKVSYPATAVASILIRSCIWPGRSRCFGRWPSSVWLRQLSLQLRHFFPYFIYLFLGIRTSFRCASCGCSSVFAHDFGIKLLNF